MIDKRLFRQRTVLVSVCAWFATFGVIGCGGGGTAAPTPQTAGTPAFAPAAGTYTQTQTVTISDATPGATVYYTLDASTPTASSSKYSTALTVAATTTVKAIAIAGNYNNSALATATYTISLPDAATPTFSPEAGTFASAQNISIADATAGATIYYTTDGTTPSASSAKYTAAIAVAASETINAIATATGYATSALGTAAYVIGSVTTSTVNVVQSKHDESQLLAAQSPVTFGTNAPMSDQIIVDEGQTFQSMDGFGASFTDSAAYLLYQVEPTSTQASTSSDLFTRAGNGIGMSFMRIPIGGSDLARTEYTFDDVAAGQTDPNLSSFSISHDQAYILPFVLAAKTLNPAMKIVASPWSPPAWMKDSQTINGGSLSSSSVYLPFSNYLVKYLQAYKTAGVPIDYLTLQNEPLNNNDGYPTMLMDAATQTTVLRDYVLPAMTAAGLMTQVFAYDHNWDNQSYAEQVLGDATIMASPLVAGSAWHGYAGVPGAQQSVQNLYPQMGTWETEHSGGTFITDQFTSDFLEITNDLRNSSKGYIKWSLALDENRGPNTTQLGLQGCNTCEGIVTVNSQTGAVTKTIEYFTLGHFSKYVLPGAKRVYSSNGMYTSSVAFINPDGSKALIAYNTSTSPQTFQVQWGTQSFSYSLPGLGAVTFTWSGTQVGTPALLATWEIQGADFSSQFGLQTENLNDNTGNGTGAYDLGYITNNAYAVYNNVSFGTTTPTQVSLRYAAGNGAGSVEFHLDSLSGMLLGTVSLAGTANYQIYATATSSLSGTVTGTHTVYVVFRSGSGLPNLAWFRFQ